MKRIVLIAVAGWLLAGTLPAWASTQTASRPALPDAKTLLSQMAKALLAKNTVHMVIDGTSKIGTQPESRTHVVTDISYRPLKLKEVSTASGMQETVIVVGDHIATQLSGHWNCIVSKQLLQQYAGITKNLNPTTVNARTVGASTIGGVSVWHIVARYVLPGSKDTMPTDMYVSQGDGTLVELTSGSTIKQAGTVIVSRTVERLSNYGEHLSISLPSSCK